MLRTCCKELFGQLEDVNLFTLKFHMPDLIVDDVSKLEHLS